MYQPRRDVLRHKKRTSVLPPLRGGSNGRRKTFKHVGDVPNVPRRPLTTHTGAYVAYVGAPERHVRVRSYLPKSTCLSSVIFLSAVMNL